MIPRRGLVGNSDEVFPLRDGIEELEIPGRGSRGLFRE
jgi:hypothetical protein